MGPLPLGKASGLGIEAWASFKSTIRRRMQPVGRAVASSGISPNGLTVVGLALNCAAAALVAAGWFAPGGAVFVFASTFDLLDGAVARATGRVSRFGAFLDSVVDRCAEAAMFVGLAIWFSRAHETSLVVGVALALVGSFLVSYTRARAEGLGLDCEIGLLQRPERVILLALGLMLADPLLAPVVWCLALATNLTALQRVLHVRRLLRTETPEERA